MTSFTYVTALAQSRGERVLSRRVANNTYAELRIVSVFDAARIIEPMSVLEWEDTPEQRRAVAVRLHDTDVVTYRANGTVSLDTGGWKTAVTKDRINSYCPSTVRVFSDKSGWRVSYGSAPYDRSSSAPFADGITFEINTLVGIGWLPVAGTYPDDAQELAAHDAKKRLDADVKKFLSKSAPSLDAWRKQIRETGSLNTSGDCLYCQGIVTTPDGAPYEGNDHLWSHLRQGYVFPSLFLLAYADKGYPNPLANLALDLTYLGGKNATTTLGKYLRKRLGASAEPQANIVLLQNYLKHAEQALQTPDDFGYFGSDKSLWQSSAPTWGKHRDSENLDIANFQVVWDTLKAEFPELLWGTCHYCALPVVRRDGDVVANDDTLTCTGEWEGQPHGYDDVLDEEGYPSRDFNEWPAIYVFGAGHWAVGHVDNIVVPVKLDPSRPVDVDNLHPAFIRVCDLVTAAVSYPALDGAEDILARLDLEEQREEVRSNLENPTEEQVTTLWETLFEDDGEFPDYLEPVEWLRVIDDVGLEPAAWLTRYRADA